VDALYDASVYITKGRCFSSSLSMLKCSDMRVVRSTNQVGRGIIGSHWVLVLVLG
jgi:hypothetical protein